MKKKEKTKKGMFSHMEFDSAQFAQDVLVEMETKLEKSKKALKISAIASVLGGLGLMGMCCAENGSSAGALLAIFLPVAVVMAIVSYVIGGGILTGIRWAGKIAFLGWLITPIFPVDLLIGFCALIFACYALFLFPIVIVSLNYFQVKKNRDEAAAYLSYCRPVSDESTVPA